MGLIFVRHTAVDAPPGLCYGRLDLDCGPGFEDAAWDVAAELRSALCNSDNTGPGLACMFRPTGSLVCHTSPLRRCTRLAGYLNTQVCSGLLDIRQDPRLQEMDFGDFEGRMWDQIPREESRVWMENWRSASCPGGESWPRVLARVADFLKDLAAAGGPSQGSTGDCLVVSHAGVWRCMRVLVDGLSPDQAFSQESLKPGGLWRFDLSGRPAGQPQEGLQGMQG